VSNSYDVDDQGRPVAAAEPAEAETAEPDPAAEAVLRRQIEQTLRAMALSTLIGLVVIVIIAIVVPSVRSVMILVGIVYVVSSLTARWYLRRKFMARLKGPGSDVS
jgi:Flp pilus assembly protein TadB